MVNSMRDLVINQILSYLDEDSDYTEEDIREMDDQELLDTLIELVSFAG